MDKLYIIAKKREGSLSAVLSTLGGGYLLSHFRSTIGVVRLNFSVRNGKRWDPHAMTTLVSSPLRHGGGVMVKEIIAGNAGRAALRLGSCSIENRARKACALIAFVLSAAPDGAAGKLSGY